MDPQITPQPEVSSPVIIKTLQDNNFNKILIAVVVVFAVFTAIVGGYYFWTNKQIKQQISTTPTQPQTTTSQTAPTSQAQTPDEFAGWKMYKDEKSGFEFKYPNDLYPADIQTKDIDLSTQFYTSPQKASGAKSCYESGKGDLQNPCGAYMVFAVRLKKYDLTKYSSLEDLKTKESINFLQSQSFVDQDKKEWVWDTGVEAEGSYYDSALLVENNNVYYVQIIISMSGLVKNKFKKDFDYHKKSDNDYLQKLYAENKLADEATKLTKQILSTFRFADNKMPSDLTSKHLSTCNTTVSYPDKSYAITKGTVPNTSNTFENKYKWIIDELNQNNRIDIVWRAEGGFDPSLGEAPVGVIDTYCYPEWGKVTNTEVFKQLVLQKSKNVKIKSINKIQKWGMDAYEISVEPDPPNSGDCEFLNSPFYCYGTHYIFAKNGIGFSVTKGGQLKYWPEEQFVEGNNEEQIQKEQELIFNNLKF